MATARLIHVLIPFVFLLQVRCLLEKPIFVKEGQLVTGIVELVANRR